MLGKYWENYTHDADIGVRGIGATLEEAFEQAATALTAAITDPLQAHLWGEEIKPHKHGPAVEVKGATYTDLRVLKDETGTWLAQCVVDV